MKNLHLTTIDEFDECTLLSRCLFMSINADSGTLYGASRDKVFAFECMEDVKVIAEASLKNEGYLDDESYIVAIHYVVDQFCLSIATSNGELILWNHDNMSHFENVGVVGDGIEDMRWSHDFELLVLVTGKSSIILMTREFEPIVESTLLSTNFGEAELVSVGWGKKETQFHGSEGKAAALKKLENSSHVFEWDDGKPRITWRGDNQYFAVHYVDPSSNSRMFKIWTREGKLHSTSTVTSGLSQSISFKNQGNLLASSVFQQGEHKVVFFEKNGLQHGEFLLPLYGDQTKVKELCWNLDSSVLAVLCEIDNSVTQVQLWTTSNYHWYMKQCLEFSGDEQISCFIWDQESPLKLHLVTSIGRHFKYNWVFAINRSMDISDENDLNVAVINGGHLHVTPFGLCVVPPPMSAYQLNIESFIHCVLFGNGEHVNDVLLLAANGFVYWFSHLISTEKAMDLGRTLILPDAMGGNGFKIQCPLPNLRAQARFPSKEMSTMRYHHFTWVDEDTLIACSTFQKQNQIVNIFRICWSSNMIFERGSVQVPKGRKILATDFNSKLKILLLQMDNGDCYKLDPYEITLSPCLERTGGQFSFPRSCFRVSLLSYEDKEILLGLTEQFRLFVNGQELAQDCTSYDMHKNFILISTHSHSLRSLHLKDFVLDDFSLSTGESTRALERGSKLVCSVPRETRVVLQMPRGNLEVIHPRSLLLEAIQANIEGINFRQAFELCRRHRVNMNILVDHNISFFIQHIITVVDQLATTPNINLLLSDIQEEDYTRSMYSSYYKNKQPVQQGHHSTKVDSVCEAFRVTMKLKDEQKYFLSILMTFLKRSPPNIEGALIEVKEMKDKLQDNLKFTDDALKFLTYMVDVNTLYDVAMGTYDLKLVLLVAEKSQKDPKEYLPYLNDLKNMTPDLMKYTIDLKLKKYSKALMHGSYLGKDHFIECKKLIVEQKLYSEALDLYVLDSTEYKEIAALHGEYLVGLKNFDEAGMMYFKAGDFGKALKMFEESKNWRLALCCASSMQFSDAEIVALARKLAGILSEAHLYLEAAQILETYADDYEEAIMALIYGHNWDEALRIIYRHKRMDLLEVNLKPSLLSSADSFIELIERTQNEFITHKDRLMEVRRLKKPQTDLIRDAMETRGNCDLYSDTSSVHDGDSIASSSVTTESRSSRRTGKSSKSRQKLARKKWSLRKGGPTEEFALIEVLHKLAALVHGWKAEMGVLLKTLVLFSNEKKARILQKKMEDIISVINECIPLIWVANSSSPSTNDDQIYGPHMSTNSIVQSLKKQNHETFVPSDPILVTPPIFDTKDSAWKLAVLGHKF